MINDPSQVHLDWFKGRRAALQEGLSDCQACGWLGASLSEFDEEAAPEEALVVGNARAFLALISAAMWSVTPMSYHVVMYTTTIMNRAKTAREAANFDEKCWEGILELDAGASSGG